jgi:hypothetical protein
VQYGTPPQTLVVNFDTGSSDNIVFSSDTPPDQVGGQTIFNIGASKTAQRVGGLSFNASFGDGSAASGIVLTDTVAIGGVAVQGMSVESMTFASKEFTQNTDVDAIMGFAFSKLNQVRPQKQLTWFEKAAPGLTENLFTANLKFNQCKNPLSSHDKFRRACEISNTSPTAGIYTFGVVDRTQFTGALAFVPLNTTTGFWQFRADGFAVNRGKGVSSPHDAFVDTGSSLTLLPPDIVSTYYSAVNGAVNSDSGIEVPCNATLPDFTLIVGNHLAVMPGRFIQTNASTTADKSLCFGGIQLQPPGFNAVYGDNFLFSQFVVFDAGNQRIGFAEKPT